MPRRVYAFVIALTAIAVLMIVTISRVWADPLPEEWIAAAVFSVLGLLAQRMTYQTERHTVGSVGFILFLSLGAVAPNLASVLAVATALTIAEFSVKRELLKRIFNVAQHTVSYAIGLFVYRAAGGESMLHSAANPIIAFAAFYATAKLGNKLLISIVLWLSGGRSVLRELNGQLRSTVVDTIALPTAYLSALAYARFGPAWATILVLPVLALRAIYKTNADLVRVNEEMLQLMVSAIEARDPYTSGHSRRVARYAEIIATTAAIPEKQVERIAMAALMHDIGKIHEVFAPILRKPDRLTPEESLVMQTHAERGADLVVQVTSFADLVKPVLHHHERWDGQGYPLGLAGDEIPLGARVINIADTIDAMTTDRPYRKALTTEVVLSELQAKKATQFDAALVDSLQHPVSWRALCAAIEDERIRALTPPEPKTMFISGSRHIPNPHSDDAQTRA